MLIDLSNYVLEPLREGEEYILYSGRSDVSVLLTASGGWERDLRRVEGAGE